MNFLLTLLTSVASLWNISVNLDNSIDFIYNNYPVLNNSCTEYVYSERGTIVSLCNKDIYYNYTLGQPINKTSQQLGKYDEQNITFNSINKNLPSVTFVFQFLEDNNNLLFYQNYHIPLYTNKISVIKNGKLGLAYPSKRLLKVPFDNDLQSFYKSEKMNSLVKGTSAYVTSIYDSSENSNRGMTIGFIQHNLWKNGIEYNGDIIHAISGINGILETRDIVPHGLVNTTNSPHLFMSINDDWRNGIEDYAIKMADFLPYSFPDREPITGWNSWAGIIDGEGRSDVNRFLNTVLLFNKLNVSSQNIEIGGDALYNLSYPDSHKWMDKNHAFKQLSSVYTSPFIIYDEKYQYVNCSLKPCNKNEYNCYLFNDIILKTYEGEPIIPLSFLSKNNTRILDVSHPITPCILDHIAIKQKLSLYDSVKMDYINIVAYEGNHFNKQIAPTGMAAYSYGLDLIDKYFTSILNVNLAISLPLPPGKDIQSRRHGCDQMFGAVVYSMNQYAGGWWLNKFYLLNPDLITFEGDYWFDPKFKTITEVLSMDAKGRIAKGVVYGGLLKNGDNLNDQFRRTLVEKYFNNSKIMNMWRLKPNFKPLSWDDHYILIGAFDPPNVFTRVNGDIAIFNYGIFKKNISVGLESLFEVDNITCISVFDNTTYKPNNYTLNIKVSETSADLLECRSN